MESYCIVGAYQLIEDVEKNCEKAVGYFALNHLDSESCTTIYSKRKISEITMEYAGSILVDPGSKVSMHFSYCQMPDCSTRTSVRISDQGKLKESGDNWDSVAIQESRILKAWQPRFEMLSGVKEYKVCLIFPQSMRNVDIVVDLC